MGNGTMAPDGIPASPAAAGAAALREPVDPDRAAAPARAATGAGAQRPAADIEAFLAGIATRAYRFAELGLRHREDARDAVQDAMLRLLDYRARPPQEWTALFWRILRSRMVDIRRRRLVRLRWLREDDGGLPAWDEAAADPAPGPARTEQARQAWLRLSAALVALPRRQREAFVLRVLEGLDVAAAASAMGCSAGAVKTHLFRAREALQRHLEEFR
jgi:RNA polymerase sigma factor (sigma-70 family)